MQPNPYEASKADPNLGEVKVASARRFKTGVRMAAISVTLPFVAWFLAHGFMSVVASIDPVPNQGAMVMAFSGVMATILAAAVLFVVGVTLALTNWSR
jgi:hypothetical protein